MKLIFFHKIHLPNESSSRYILQPTYPHGHLELQIKSTNFHPIKYYHARNNLFKFIINIIIIVIHTILHRLSKWNIYLIFNSIFSNTISLRSVYLIILD